MHLRWFQLGAVVLALASCNSILGNVDYHLVEPSAGTDSGGTDAGTAGSRGSGGSAAAAGVDTGAGVGAGGEPESDACVGTACTTPPGPSCVSPEQLKAYDKVGSCSKGTCSYTSHAISCTCEGDACTTDPCLTVMCASPPSNSCKDAGTKTTYAATGTCSDGGCSYASSDEGCDTNQRCSGAGVCSVCTADDSCGADCTQCAGSAKKCKDLGTTSKCVACLSNADCAWPTPKCNTTTNVCEAPPSCSGLAKTCGPNGNADCCAANLVTGGTFNRSNDPAYPATIADFRLDNYEITVGRFRKFVAAYSHAMTEAGAGKNPNNPSDPGWNVFWNAGLPDTGMLSGSLKCYEANNSWTDTAGSAAAESLPINCTTWFEAEAFCIWDGGRLPTEAEWNYAAAGGAAQRTYPWGNQAPDCSYANFLNTDYCVLPGTGAVNRVGSESPKGDGLFGQADLAGNVEEWTQDWYASAYRNPCNNCANLDDSAYRTARGGSLHLDASYLLSSARSNPSPASPYDLGARCARTP